MWWRPGFFHAHLCGAAPIPASSGRVRRHRLHRGGDRGANHALHTIALCRLRYDPRARAYQHRRITEGLSKQEILRCLNWGSIGSAIPPRGRGSSVSVGGRLRCRAA